MKILLFLLSLVLISAKIRSSRFLQSTGPIPLSCATGSSSFKSICSICHLPSNFSLNAVQQTSSSGDQIFSSTLPTFNLMETISKSFPPILKKMSEKLGFTVLSLNSPQITVNLGATQAIKFNGTFDVLGLKGIRFDLLAIKAFAYNDLSSGVLLSAALPYSSLSDFIEKIVPIKINALLDMFDGGSAFTLSLANDDLEFGRVEELKPEYLGQKVLKGFTASAVLKFGEGNAISKFMRRFGEDFGLVLSITVTEEMLSASAGIMNMEIGKGFLIEETAFYFSFEFKNPQPTIGVRGSLVVPVGNGETITLGGDLSFSPIDAGLEFTMKDLWKGAFGIKRFTFGNLILSGKISYASGVPSAIQVGGEVAIGLDCYGQGNDKSVFLGDGHCIRAQAYVGIDATQPENNYFFFNASRIDLDTIMRAMLGSKTEQKVQIPTILNDAIQFPLGATVSYAVQGHSLPNIDVKEGLRVFGKLQVFDAWAFVDIEVSLSNLVFFANITCSPIKLKVFELTANDGNSGPIMTIGVKYNPPTFAALIDAKLTVLGITSAVLIDIGLEKMSFFINGPILGGFFLAELRFEASHEGFKSANFYFKGVLKTNQVLLNVIEGVSERVSKKLIEGAEQVRIANEKVEEAQQKLNDQKAKVCENIEKQCAKRGNCHTSHDGDCKKFGEKMECTQMENECTGGWGKECIEHTSKCIQSIKVKFFQFFCKAFDKVCTKSKDVCKGFSKVCKATRKVVDLSNCIVREKICDAYDWVVDTSCKAGCNAAKAGFNIAVGSMEAAQGVLKASEKTSGAFARAFKAISKVGNVFNIKNASLEGYLNTGTVNGLSLGIDVGLDVVILGKATQVKVKFDFKNVEKIIIEIAKEVLEKIKDFFGKY